MIHIVELIVDDVDVLNIEVDMIEMHHVLNDMLKLIDENDDAIHLMLMYEVGHDEIVEAENYDE